MGLMENMVNTQSIKLIPRSRRPHFQDTLGRTPMKGSPFQGLVGVSKHKQQRLSAVRDLPRGCRRFPAGIGVGKPEVFCADVMENRAFAGSSKAPVVVDASSYVLDEGDLNRDEIARKIVEPTPKKAESGGRPLLELEPGEIVEKLNYSNQADDGFEPMKVDRVKWPLADLEEGEICEVSESSHQNRVLDSEKSDPVQTRLPRYEHGNGSKHVNSLGKAVEKSYPPRRRVSAIRDFPPYVGCHAPLLSSEEISRVVACTEHKSVGVEKVVQGDTKAKSKESSWEPNLNLVDGNLGTASVTSDRNIGFLKKDKGKEIVVYKGDMNRDEIARKIVEPTPKKAESGGRALLELEPDEIVEKLNYSNQADDGFEPMKFDRVKWSLADLEEGEICEVSEGSHQNRVLDLEKSDPVQTRLPRYKHGDGSKHVNSLGKAVRKSYPPRRQVSAIRDFPPYVGCHAPLLSSEEISRVVACAENKSVGVGVEKVVQGDTKAKSKESSCEPNLNLVDGNSMTASVTSERNIGFPKKDKGKEIAVSKGTHSPVSVTSETTIEFLKEDKGKEIVVYKGTHSPDGELPKISVFMDQPQEERSANLGFTMKKNQMYTVSSNRSLMEKKKVYGDSDGRVDRETQKCDFERIQPPRPTQKLTKRTHEDEGPTKNQGSFPNKKPSKQTKLIVGNKGYPREALITRKLNMSKRRRKLGMSIRPYRPVSLSSQVANNNAVGAREKVQETLRLYQVVFRKLLREKEAKPGGSLNCSNRMDFNAREVLKAEGKLINTGKIIGCVPGVEVGDEFQFRVEMNIIGLHHPLMFGIDTVKKDGMLLATSIVSSGSYDDELDNSDVLIYTGQGGNVMEANKEPEDQKLEKGNLALANSIHAKNPVRVIRGEAKTHDSLDTRGKRYVYDGLYLVENMWKETGPRGKLVFKFRLRRIPGQPELGWNVMRKSKTSKFRREALILDDISRGKEKIPIPVVNDIDDEKPSPFRYTSKMIYPAWCQPVSPQGCGCTTGCSESKNCHCARKNAGDLPYNYNGAIVEAKPLVYECGPHCKCPPSCYNKVSQKGIRFHLEVFKTESKGWGVRSLDFIPSGSFICEYTGELLKDEEVEARTGHDDYLFDIGNDNVMEEGDGFTIDAAKDGNVGRFINHSCSPNLYAQNVLYDHWDRRIPHVMLFAADNIPPLKELTFHYNYVIDRVFDSEGNIKKKDCFCGSSDCIGRMY